MKRGANVRIRYDSFWRSTIVVTRGTGISRYVRAGRLLARAISCNRVS